MSGIPTSALVVLTVTGGWIAVCFLLWLIDLATGPIDGDER